jgi:hypothetical protein
LQEFLGKWIIKKYILNNTRSSIDERREDSMNNGRSILSTAVG